MRLWPWADRKQKVCRGHQTAQHEEAQVGKGSVEVQAFPYHVFHAPVLKTKYMAFSLHQMWWKDGGKQALRYEPQSTPRTRTNGCHAGSSSSGMHQR